MTPRQHVERRVITAALTTAYVLLVVGLAGGLASALTSGDGVTHVATALGPVALAFTLRPVARRIRSWTKVDATSLAPLVEVARSLATVVEIDDALPLAVDAMLRETGADTVGVWSARGDRPVLVAVAPDAAVPTFDDGSVVPIRSHGVTIGWLQLVAREPSEESARLQRALADQVGPALRNLALRHELDERVAARRDANERLKDARRRIVELGDQERLMLERDLHDGAQQSLMALVLRLGLAERLPTRATPTPADLRVLSTEARRQLLAASTGLVADDLAGARLPDALVVMARAGDIALDVDASFVDDLPGHVAKAVYFTCVEAIQNAGKHGRARTASVRLAVDDHGLHFEITDHGAGFDVDATAPGFGIRSMRDRIAALGGSFAIRSADDQGAVVSGFLPMAGEVPA